jgi:TolB protein
VSLPRRRAADWAPILDQPGPGFRRFVLLAGAGALVLLAWLGVHAVDWFEPPNHRSPAWFPDGRTIVFSAVQPDGSADLFQTDAMGGPPLRLTETAATEDGPAISPDSAHVAFESDRDGQFDIYVMRRGRPDVRRVTTSPARDISPAWSPSGDRIAFMSDRDSTPLFDLYVVNVDGSGLRRLTTGGGYGFPRFSPGGGQIAMQHGSDVHVLDLNDGRIHPLTHEPRGGTYPTWSPDGQRLAFASRRSGRSELFLMNTDGTDASVAVSTFTGSAVAPRWSPNGDRLVFVRAEDEDAETMPGAPPPGGAIYVVDLETGELTRISP